MREGCVKGVLQVFVEEKMRNFFRFFAVAGTRGKIVILRHGLFHDRDCSHCCLMGR